jgi:hypothetical protein
MEFLFEPKRNLILNISRLLGHFKKRFFEHRIVFENFNHVVLQGLDIDIYFIEHQEVYSFFAKRLFPQIFYGWHVGIWLTFLDWVINLFEK